MTHQLLGEMAAHDTPLMDSRLDSLACAELIRRLNDRFVAELPPCNLLVRSRAVARGAGPIARSCTMPLGSCSRNPTLAQVPWSWSRHQAGHRNPLQPSCICCTRAPRTSWGQNMSTQRCQPEIRRGLTVIRTILISLRLQV